MNASRSLQGILSNCNRIWLCEKYDASKASEES